MTHTRTPIAERAALYGKLPWAPDYVRIQHVHPAAIALDSWLSASLQPLARAKVRWPDESVHFVLNVPREQALLAGVLAPSRDRAGREFPVAVFATLPSAPIGPHFSALPRLVTPFLDQVEALLARRATLDRTATHEAVAALVTPRLSLLRDTARQVSHALSSRTAQRQASLLATDVRASSATPRTRALRAFCALSGSTHGPSLRASMQTPVFDCPIDSALDLEAWLALRGPAAHASLFWTPRAHPPRLLLACDTLPAALPLWLAQPSLKSDRLVALAQAESGAAETLLPRLRADDWDLSIERFAARLAQLVTEPSDAR